jgi:hypothetical protein
VERLWLRRKVYPRVPERTLGDWYHGFVERQQAAAARTPVGPIRRIGIDELALKNGTGSSSR